MPNLRPSVCPPVCPHDLREPQALPGLLAGAMLAVWWMLGGADPAAAQTTTQTPARTGGLSAEVMPDASFEQLRAAAKAAGATAPVPAATVMGSSSAAGVQPASVQAAGASAGGVGRSGAGKSSPTTAALPTATLNASAPTPTPVAAGGATTLQSSTGTSAAAVSPGPAGSPASPPVIDDALQQSLQFLATAAARQAAPTQARVEVTLGRLDPRLRLAPCQQIQPYLPPGLKMWGKTRIGLRCLAGQTKWNVTLPLQIKVYGPAYVASADLPTGTTLTQEHLRLAEVDIAGEAGAIFTQPGGWLGRQLIRPVGAGEALRSADLKLRHWAQPGDRVQVLATGNGYAVAGEGQALGVALEGQEVRVRFDNGRMVTGRTVGERKVEVAL